MFSGIPAQPASRTRRTPATSLIVPRFLQARCPGATASAANPASDRSLHALAHHFRRPDESALLAWQEGYPLRQRTRPDDRASARCDRQSHELRHLRLRPAPLRWLRARHEARRHPRPRVQDREHTSELQSQSNLVCRLLLEKKKWTTSPLGVRLLRSARRTSALSSSSSKPWT